MAIVACFRATDEQVREMVRLVVVASGYSDEGGPLGSLQVIERWRGKPLYWMCLRGNAPNEWRLVHGLDNHLRLRPWAHQYPDASSLLRAAGLRALRESDDLTPRGEAP